MQKYSARLAITLVALCVPCAYFFVDYLVYQFGAELHALFAEMPVDVSSPMSIPGVRVSGEGAMAKLYNLVIGNLMPPVESASNAAHTWHLCFEEPSPPDWWFMLVSSVARSLISPPRSAL